MSKGIRRAVDLPEEYRTASLETLPESLQSIVVELVQTKFSLVIAPDKCLEEGRGTWDHQALKDIQRTRAEELEAFQNSFPRIEARQERYVVFYELWDGDHIMFREELFVNTIIKNSVNKIGIFRAAAKTHALDKLWCNGYNPKTWCWDDAELIIISAKKVS